MDAAFQRMLDECRTPYYVQVLDEDMLLHPHAVRTLHDAMAAAPADVAVIVHDLYDVTSSRCIFGVKIFRTRSCAAIRFAPSRRSRSSRCSASRRTATGW
ncbi:MAG: hypothetical protein U0802_22905 [Candidatus Binatia bacterium]